LQHLRFSWRWSLVVQEGLMVVQSLAELLSL
jgi:peroxiredoxin